MTHTDPLVDSSTPDAPDEAVGSIAQEAFKLFRAVGAPQHTADQGDEAHACSTAWCPVCQVAGFVRDNPDALAKVSESAAQLTRSLRDLLDTALNPRDDS